MKTMKKAMALALSAMMLVAALTGCGSSKTPAASGSGSGSQAGSSAAELDYPKQNINVVVQYSAGGGTDLSVRGVLDGVKDVPVNFSVSNVTGNGGLIGLTQVANSKADGYTLGVVNTDFIINMVLGNTDMTLDTFSPLACALRDPFVLIIGNNENYSTLEEFVDYAKAHPGEIVVGETGTGAAPTLAITAMENALGIDVSNVTYEGSADCVTAVAEIYPDQIDFEFMGFCVISCPAGVDSAIQDYLSEKLRAGVDSDSFAQTLDSLGMQTTNMDQAQLKEFLQQQYELYDELLGNQ